MNLNKCKNLAVHNGNFHSDGVFAVALIKLINSKIKIIKTCDEKIIDNSILK